MRNYGERSEAKNFWKYVKRNMLFAFINTVKNIFPVSQNFPCVTTKFPVFSPTGKSKNQIPCFPCAVVTLEHSNRLQVAILFQKVNIQPEGYKGIRRDFAKKITFVIVFLEV